MNYAINITIISDKTGLLDSLCYHFQKIFNNTVSYIVKKIRK